MMTNQLLKKKIKLSFFLMFVLWISTTLISCGQSTKGQMNEAGFSELLDSLNYYPHLNYKLDSTDKGIIVMVSDYSTFPTQRFMFSNQGEFQTYELLFRYNSLHEPVFFIDAVPNEVSLKDTTLFLESFFAQGEPYYFYRKSINDSTDQIFINLATPVLFKLYLKLTSFKPDGEEKVIYDQFLNADDGLVGIQTKKMQGGKKYNYKYEFSLKIFHNGSLFQEYKETINEDRFN